MWDPAQAAVYSPNQPRQCLRQLKSIVLQHSRDPIEQQKTALSILPGANQYAGRSARLQMIPPDPTKATTTRNNVNCNAPLLSAPTMVCKPANWTLWLQNRVLQRTSMQFGDSVNENGTKR
jgi:hypothetical protein